MIEQRPVTQTQAAHGEPGWKLRRGLDVPLAGAPEQLIDDTLPAPSQVALMPPDYIGCKPALQCQLGERIQRGQLLFYDKHNEAVRYTAPGGGTISAINRGAKRALLSIVIELAAAEREEKVAFPVVERPRLAELSPTQVRDQLLLCGLWTVFRTRPFSKVPAPDSLPHSIFITAIDTNPLAADPMPLILAKHEDFVDGLRLLRQLISAAPLFLCRAPGAKLPIPEELALRVAEFSGPHPAGLVGTHIHLLDPVRSHKTVWHLNYQDVIAIGQLFTSGELPVERVVSLAGPPLLRPRLVRTRLGANLDELCTGQLQTTEEHRIISGSVLSGHHATGALAFLGRHHLQVSVLSEQRERKLFGWLTAGSNRHSNLGIYLSHFARQPLPLGTSTHGSERAIVPTGSFERVMPLDFLPTLFLRYLVAGDIETVQRLGALELDEEDLALCSYVCSGKHEYGPILRDVLNQIEREG